jgi:hypothetical protein
VIPIGGGGLASGSRSRCARRPGCASSASRRAVDGYTIADGIAVKRRAS